MNSDAKIKELIFDPSISFADKVNEVLQYQLRNIPTYRLYASQITQADPTKANPCTLPYLPVELFKTQEITALEHTPRIAFESSGTTGSMNSKHGVVDIDLYHQSIQKGFELVYGAPGKHVFFALLPSYLERENSSLIYMVKHLMDLSGEKAGGFYKFDHDRLLLDIQRYAGDRKKVLIGVSFALLDMAEKYPTDLSEAILMETGGMKGKRRELIRKELHQILMDAFNINAVHSEYGMTELLSQAYSTGDGIFRSPPWMKVLVRDPYDPLNVQESGKGALNIIDLANLYSCSFIATNDLGVVYADGSFEVRGRIDGSALRGCNLMF